MTDTQELRDELVALEERFWLEGGANPDFWRHHFADDGVVALSFGLMGKTRTVDAMARGTPWERVRMDDLRVVPLTEASALVAYTATAARVDDAEPYTAVVGSVYAQRDGAWRLCFHQQSVLAEPPAV